MSTSTSVDAVSSKPGPPDTMVWRFNDDPMPKVPQTGGCHCGAVRFHIQHEKLTKEPRYHIPVKMCNCSIRGRNGYLMIYSERDEFEWISGKDTLSEYRFESEKKEHKFCPHCGSSVCMDLEWTWQSWAGDVVGINLQSQTRPVDTNAYCNRQVRMLDDWDFDNLNLHRKNSKDGGP
ncbi:putative CENP-V/GFA domain-containing protein [Seiridium unicorne]|uniref:CENP-V/GFA domain-containing protein n=1 Tax=Seiridium unicorne TaxID=138068 RepID=A0ABR2V1F5_9PEZI